MPSQTVSDDDLIKFWNVLCPTAPAFELFIESFPETTCGEGKPTVSTDVLRLDKVDTELSGNKLFKLLGHLRSWQSSGKTGVISFGGRWSNHLHALAVVCRRMNIPVSAMVLGYEAQPLTATLKDCLSNGMLLTFCNRVEYAKRYDADWRDCLSEDSGAWVIPEGGEGPEGELGLSLLADVIRPYDEIWVAAGTGTTARGLANHMGAAQTLHIVNAVADQGALAQASRHWVTDAQVKVHDEFHGGGFGRVSTELLDLVRCYDSLGLPLEPVYTAKVAKAMNATFYENGTRRLMIHTGGLQGRRGFPV